MTPLPSIYLLACWWLRNTKTLHCTSILSEGMTPTWTVKFVCRVISQPLIVILLLCNFCMHPAACCMYRIYPAAYIYMIWIQDIYKATTRPRNGRCSPLRRLIRPTLLSLLFYLYCNKVHLSTWGGGRGGSEAIYTPNNLACTVSHSRSRLCAQIYKLGLDFK